MIGVYFSVVSVVGNASDTVTGVPADAIDLVTVNQ
ncbi:hypothetical protein SAMN05421760_101400 [Neptunomonas antarctica]|uniref:Uncharacterized protein n=1 Tax=Neptunomonas antarctica TaxID=619304 RepID=A0A1N7J018_9GAMM|nr:hypothetical protein SAMN05421760_101400 [Neptunomonas antarctica]